LWPFFLGGLFIAVVRFFPDGCVGLIRMLYERVPRWVQGWAWKPAASLVRGRPPEVR
jgi:hypothetical protein